MFSRRLLGAALAALLVILIGRPAQAEAAGPEAGLSVTGGRVVVEFAPELPAAERAAVLAAGQRLAGLLDQELGPIRRADTATPGAVASGVPATILGEVAWRSANQSPSNWTEFARELWNLWWQEPNGPVAAMLRLPGSSPVAAAPDAADPAQILQGTVDLWLEEALVRVNLASAESLAASLQLDRQVYEQAQQAQPAGSAGMAGTAESASPPTSADWRRAAGRLQGLALDDRLRAREVPLNLGRIFRFLRLEADPAAEPATLAGGLGVTTGEDVAGLTADFLQGRFPVPLESLLQAAPGRTWPAFWERLRQQEFVSVGVLVDDQPLGMEVAPALVNGRMLVPLRAIFEALGAAVDYNDEKRQITAAKEGRRVILWPDDPLARIDERLLWLDAAPQVYDGRTLVPVRFVSEALSAAVDWVGATRTVVIRRAPQPLEPLGPEPTEGRKVAYLTFDDGPSAQHTAAVLDILGKYGVKATFFVVGKYALAYPELAKREVAAGHALGNHSYDHDYGKIYASQAAFLDSVRQAEEAIATATGERPSLLRAPGGTAGHLSKEDLQALHEAGYAVFDWNVSTADSSWPRPSAADILTDVGAYSYGGKVKQAIILMHDGAGHPTTVEALPAVIAYLVEHGYLLRPLAPDSPLAK
ncbi:MAG: polysaccharide deacetylase family protein [Symbiobacteriia bacterium]